jgi:hypothetical protein
MWTVLGPKPPPEDKAEEKEKAAKKKKTKKVASIFYSVPVVPNCCFIIS